MSDTIGLVKMQLEILKTDYCIFLAEIIEGKLKFGNSPDFEKWKADDLPIWEEKLAGCASDIRAYWEYIQEEKDFLQNYSFGLKGGVKGCIEANLRLLEREKNEVDRELDLKQQLGLPLDKDTARRMLKTLNNHQYMSNKLKLYLVDFDQNFEKDVSEILEPAKYHIPQLELLQAAV